MTKEYYSYDLNPLFEREDYRFLEYAKNMLRNVGAYAENATDLDEDEYCPPDTYWISPVQIFELSFYKVR